MRRTALILSTFLATAAWNASAVAAEPKSWEFGGRGRWSEVNQPSSKPVANSALDRVEQLLSAGNSSTALSAVLDWIKSPANRQAPDRDRALFLLAQAYYGEDDRVVAFYHLDELMDFYPESRFFTPALEKQYQIADEYLKGHKRKFLGFRLLSMTDEAIDMLYRIQERSPGSPLAERALLRTADYYFSASQFDLAGDAYTAYSRSYPRSPEIGRVRLHRALSSFAQFRGTRFDATTLIDARAQFEDLKTQYPQIAEQANVQKFIDTINTALAKKMLGTAEFYRRTSKPKASAYALLTLTKTYPKSAEADQAREQLARLPAWAVEQAEQAKGSEAATRPIGPEVPAELRPSSK